MELHEHFAHHESGHFRYRHSWTTARSQPKDQLLIWVLAGELDVLLGDHDLLARPGDLVSLPPGVPHRYRPRHDTGWEWLWLHYGGPLGSAVAERLQGHPARPVRPYGEDRQLRARFAELITLGAGADLVGAESPSSIVAGALAVDAAALSLLALLALGLEARGRPARGSGAATDTVSALTTWVLDHLDEPMVLADLVRASGWSPAHLSRLLRQELGLSPMQYVTRLKVRRAEQLLLHTPLTVGQVARLVGFADPLHFSRRFRQVSGRSPAAFRRAAP